MKSVDPLVKLFKSLYIYVITLVNIAVLNDT